MNRVVRTDYRAVNRMGVTVYTFSDPDRARSWAKENAHRHDGLTIETVTLTETVTRLYRPRNPVSPFAFPQMPRMEVSA